MMIIKEVFTFPTVSSKDVDSIEEYKNKNRHFYHQLTIIQISSKMNSFLSVVTANTFTIETIRMIGTESNSLVFLSFFTSPLYRLKFCEEKFFHHSKLWTVIIGICLLDIIEPVDGQSPFMKSKKRRYKLIPFYDGDIKISDPSKPVRFLKDLEKQGLVQFCHIH
ncbi:unnamed protein product [Wuchereria bancrofti]|uniref:Uncharacterized protein n=1 Tax=Wuchereria bancrofti TaxID=6293 RepID=A0A3P7FU70_WUCBA|nr:unnamed protein product [Wuchereria bancrofti]